MNKEEFDYILGNRVDKIRKTLSVKAKEYALGVGSITLNAAQQCLTLRHARHYGEFQLCENECDIYEVVGNIYDNLELL